MKLSKIFLAALIAVFGATSELYAKPQQSLKIVATVNDEIISSADFQNQLKLFLLTTKIPFNEHTQNMILERVLNSAIDEKIKLFAFGVIKPNEISIKVIRILRIAFNLFSSDKRGLI